MILLSHAALFHFILLSWTILTFRLEWGKTNWNCKQSHGTYIDYSMLGWLVGFIDVGDRWQEGYDPRKISPGQELSEQGKSRNFIKKATKYKKTNQFPKED